MSVSLERYRGNVIFSAAIEDRQSKLSEMITMTNAHMSILLFVRMSVCHASKDINYEFCIVSHFIFFVISTDKLLYNLLCPFIHSRIFLCFATLVVVILGQILRPNSKKLYILEDIFELFWEILILCWPILLLWLHLKNVIVHFFVADFCSTKSH